MTSLSGPIAIPTSWSHQRLEVNQEVLAVQRPSIDEAGLARDAIAVRAAHLGQSPSATRRGPWADTDPTMRRKRATRTASFLNTEAFPVERPETMANTVTVSS